MNLLCIFFLIISCDGEDERCTGQLACTEIFKMVTVEVRTENGELLTLDSTTVKNMTTGSVKVAEHRFNTDYYSYYIIADDSDSEMISFRGTTFQFMGWSDSVLVVEEEFLIGKDCCHIKKIEGPDEITVD